MNIKVDNCEYCACVTSIKIPDSMTIERGIEDGEIACCNCAEDENLHTSFDVYKDDKLVWCGHEVKCN